jgi:inward rectifier potassium channel
VVHPISEDSPLFEFTKEDFETIHGEILVFIKTFDDMFSNTVAIRTSHVFEEAVYGAKFQPMYSRNDTNTKTILHLDKLNHFDSVSL